MAAQNDTEEAVRTLEDGGNEQQSEALEKLRQVSKTKPEDLISHLDVICSFASDEDTEIQRDVATILAHVAGDKPSAVIPHGGVVDTLLLHDDPIVLAFATAAAMRITPESPAVLSDATDRLTELLTYENEGTPDLASSTRSRAVLALGDLGEADPSLATRLDELLAERLDDEDALVRSSTVITLKQLGLTHPEAVSTALSRLPARLNDSDRETRYQAILAVVNLRHEQPDAITQPDAVATALRQSVEKTDLDAEETKTVEETYQYLENMSIEDN